MVQKTTSNYIHPVQIENASAGAMRDYETSVRLRMEKQNARGFGAILLTKCGYEFYSPNMPDPYQPLIYICPIHIEMERCTFADKADKVKALSIHSAKAPAGTSPKEHRKGSISQRSYWEKVRTPRTESG